MKVKKVYQCPECGYKLETETIIPDNTEVKIELVGKANICPNCGKELVEDSEKIVYVK